MQVKHHGTFVPYTYLFALVSLCISAACASREAKQGDYALTSLGTLNYGQAAQAQVGPEYDAAIESMQGQFHDEILPHEAKDVRKDILRVRELIDLFIYAYPFTDEVDPISELRADLDEGYEKIGAFKDLYDSQTPGPAATGTVAPEYEDMELVEKRRKKVLDWAEGFLAPEATSFYSKYLGTASINEIYQRKKKDLAPFLWGGSDLLPDPRLPAREVFRVFLRDLLKQSADEADDVLEIDNLLAGKQEEMFHDFRKRLRVALKIPAYFPEVEPTASTALGEAKVILSRAVEEFGTVNDKLVAYHLAEEDGKKNKMKALEGEIDDQWDDLKEWMKDNDVEGQVKIFRSLL